jgi:hypothetical protein
MIGGAIIGNIAGVAGYTTLFNVCGVLLLGALVFFFVITGKKKGLSTP